MALRFRRMLWHLLYPLRLWIRWCPWRLGKGFVTRALIVPALPPAPASFEVLTPGGTLALQYREALGLTTLLRGLFEEAELAWIGRNIPPGACVVDVGANIGWFSCALAQAVGPAGSVWAFEPATANLGRLHAHLARNDLRQVTVFPCALGAADGQGNLLLADDSAYFSLVAVAGGHGTGTTESVPVRALDALWCAHGQPDIAFIKIDVEGSELAVLEGAVQILQHSRPQLLLEANSVADRERLECYLTRFGYALQPVPGFQSWNYLFVKS